MKRRYVLFGITPHELLRVIEHAHVPGVRASNVEPDRWCLIATINPGTSAARQVKVARRFRQLGWDVSPDDIETIAGRTMAWVPMAAGAKHAIIEADDEPERTLELLSMLLMPLLEAGYDGMYASERDIEAGL